MVNPSLVYTSSLLVLVSAASCVAYFIRDWSDPPGDMQARSVDFSRWPIRCAHSLTSGG